METFINVAKELPNIKFVWVGETTFKILAADYGKMKKIQIKAPKNAIFTGVVPFEDIPSYYNAADILFFPSFRESFGFAVVEAAALRLPLILRDLKVYKPIFGNNFIKGKENTFKNLIQKLEKDKKFYREYSKKAYKIAKKYEDIKVAEELKKIYQKVLNNKNDLS